MDPGQVSLSSGGESCIRQIQSWINTCTNNHEMCKLYRDKIPWRPTRLLDVHADPITYIQLITSKEAVFEKDEGYLTLSHCWGAKGQPITLLASNLEALKQGVELSALPKTFQNAVYVTRGLRYRYLWIDSLCIIQDDTRDWQQESMTMADVYRNSSCTIAASAASDSSKGMFYDRSTRNIASPVYKFNDEKYIFLQMNDNNTLLSAPLNGRAWAFQGTS